MHSISRVFRFRLAFLALIAVSAAACSVESQNAPSLTGPSELGLSVSLTASPDVLPRDGSSRSVITAIVRGPNGDSDRKAGQRLALSATAGLLSATDVVTGADGTASFELTAPSLNQAVTSALVGVTPVGGNFLNSTTHVVAIAVYGPSVPVPFFTFVPQSPARFELVTFDATTSTLDGRSCGSTCSYSWAFGTEATASGQSVQYRFQTQGVYSVTLTVTSPSGTSASITRSVIVSGPAGPTASFSFSPIDPKAGDTVFFNASTSTAPNGATITEYRWNFGNGATFTSATPTAQTSFTAARSYSVSLTVVDSNNQTATVLGTVTVSDP